MTNYGCSGLCIRSLGVLTASTYKHRGCEKLKSFLHPGWVFCVQRNFKWTLGGKKKDGKKKDDKKNDKGPDCPQEKPAEPPNEAAKECTSCPKERTHVCSESVVTAKTGMVMPALILGTWKTNTFEIAQKAIKTAFKVGYRAIDTSTFYGNEEVLGCAIPPALEEAQLCREDIFIITKLPFDAMRCEKVTDYLCKSLALLKTPYIDLYMLNFPAGSIKDENGKYIPDPRVDHNCIWKGMELAVESGKAKYIGVGNFNCDQLECLVNNSKIKPSNIQIEMHAYFQQKSYRRVAKELGLTVTAYAPLGRSPAMEKWMKENGVEDKKANPTSDPVVNEIAKRLCKSPAQVLLRFLLQLDDNLAVVIGGSEPKVICDNYNIYDFQLDDADMCKLKNIDRGKASRLFGKGFFKLLFPGVENHPLFPWSDC